MADACPFCAPEATRIFHVGPLVLGIWDAFPVAPGHALLVTKRHVASWFEATANERTGLLGAIDAAREEILRTHQPDGFNLGINVGTAAGQTVDHVHVHVIPRYQGDMADPRGGVRHVIPAQGNYLARPPGRVPAADGAPLPRAVAEGLASPPAPLPVPYERALVSGGDDALLPHVLDHLEAAARVDIAVAFILPSGVALIEARLADLLERGGRARILTGDYLDATDPAACRRLLDLRERFGDALELRVFQTAGGPSFHPKAYIFQPTTGDAIAYVGSSNLTRTALVDGVEWNFRVAPSPDPRGLRETRDAFDALFEHPRTVELTATWLADYARRRATRATSQPEPPEAPPEPPPVVPEPHEVQREALRALEQTRGVGNTAGLVVLATGLGKTWLSAFDSARPEFRRVLFVAHREEILGQALRTFRTIRPDAVLGLYTGSEKRPDADVVFASIQTLGRKRHLRQFGQTEFDYIVVDEFHHAAARTYRQLLDHFEPRFLLGLTATPERTDGGDLLALCQENLVYRCDLTDGIARGLLSPFHYFGVPDEVDYAQIPWRSSRFDEEALTTAVATESRAENALEQHQKRGGARTLAFCCSRRHADFMAEHFNDAGVRSAAVHSGDTTAPRAASLERLRDGELDVVFAVDMFNEGVDIPAIDTVLMLRPTESRILFLQQLGRGLRKADDKDHLTVIDYIGNHRSFLLKPQTLFDLGSKHEDLARQLKLVEQGEAKLPPGCEVTYELESLDLLRAMLRLPKKADALRAYCIDFHERHGQPPRAVEAFHDGYNPRAARKAHGSWLRFLDELGYLPSTARAVLDRVGDFLDTLEVTPMTKSYKMLVLLAMLNEDALPGAIAIDDLCDAFARVASRSARLRAELGEALQDRERIQKLLEENPIAAWAGARGTGGVHYFRYEADTFHADIDIAPDARDTFQELVREVVDWRLAAYIESLPLLAVAAGAFRCRVSQSNGRPILFLPDRDRVPGIPFGPTPVYVAGQRHEANFVKVALNVLTRPPSPRNELPAVLRSFFGPDAGLPGTQHHVVFVPQDDGFELRPAGDVDAASGPELWRSYSREQLPSLLGMRASPAFMQTGFIHQEDTLVLLVTLNKSAHREEHKYTDRFLAPDLFQWQSQNRTTQRGKPGQAIRHHADRNIPVHLFVRADPKIEGRAAPFIYCGQLTFEDWEGERPITVRWRLREALPERLLETFGVSR